MDTKYLKGVLKYMLSAVLCLVLIAYIIYHLTGGLRYDIETTPAQLSTVESTVTATVTVLRNETLIYPQTSGDVSYLYNDGDKIAKNSVLAEVYPSGLDKDVSRRLFELDRAIRLLESSNMSESEKRTDTASTDVLIRNHLYAILDSADKGNISQADTIADDFLIQLNKRRIITKSVKNFNEQIAKLKAERNMLAATMPGSESTVISDRVGYFYSTIDGYESVISSENIEKLSYSQYIDMVRSEPKTYAEGENAPIGKLVTDFSWYIACEIDMSELHNYETGKKYSVKFPYNNDLSIPMEMFRIISDAGSQNAVLVFRSDIIPKDFNYLRRQTVQIVKEAYTGYRIPVSAVRVVNGNSGVYILQGSKVIFKKIIPLYEFDGYIVAAEQSKDVDNYRSYLAKNDFVIVKGTELYDGKIIS